MLKHSCRYVFVRCSYIAAEALFTTGIELASHDVHKILVLRLLLSSFICKVGLGIFTLPRANRQGYPSADRSFHALVQLWDVEMGLISRNRVVAVGLLASAVAVAWVGGARAENVMNQASPAANAVSIGQPGLPAQPVVAQQAPAPQQAPAAQQQGQAKQPSPITQAVAKAGVRECLGRVDQVSKFLTASGQSAAFLFLHPQDANRHVVSASLEVAGQNNAATYASASFAASGAGGCDGMYETVLYWNSRCEDVETKTFAKFKRTGALRQNIISLNGGATVRVYLMPAGPGCVSIKKEVVY